MKFPHMKEMGKARDLCTLGRYETQRPATWRKIIAVIIVSANHTSKGHDVGFRGRQGNGHDLLKKLLTPFSSLQVDWRSS